MNSGKAVLGVLAGVAAGAILGILFAPDKGSETRKKISKKGADTFDGLKEKFDDLLKSVQEKFESAKEEATDAFEKGKSKAEAIKKEATSMN